MRMQAVASAISVALVLALGVLASSAEALVSAPEAGLPSPKAIKELKETIVKGLGFQTDDVKVSGFDLRDAFVGKSVAYEFDIEIDNMVLPIKLLEDVKHWEYVDFPIFRAEDPVKEGGLIERGKLEKGLPILAPFQLEGPMELWIQDAKDMRISLPNDVDAGVLKKVMLAEGAVVTVKGARSVSLRHPVDLPLPLNRTKSGFATALLTLAERLRHASLIKNAPPLSLRIVGPTSLASPSSPYPDNKLKLKRLAPGLVELSSPSKSKAIEAIPAFDLQEATSLLSPRRFKTLWPLASLNGTNSNLLGFEALLASVLGSKAEEEGSFKLLKADVSAQTFLKIGFEMERKVKGNEAGWKDFPEWRTKPETVRMHFEVLAKVDGEKVVPEKVVQVKPFAVEDAIAPNLLTGNITMSTVPVIHHPPNPFTL